MPLEPLPTAVIDRSAPTTSPRGRSVMRQSWSKLLFLHWAVDPAQLRPLLPPGLELDTFEDKAYVGLVLFTMTGVRPNWAPTFAPLSNFHETNVRTYVHYQGRNPGVWFFSLDAANAVAVRIARAWFKLPYHFARMSLQRHAKGEIDYTSQRLWPGPTPATCVARYTPCGKVQSAAVGTLEHFLVERYILYSYAGGQLFRGRVHHRPYPLQAARLTSLDENLVAAAGITRPAVAPLTHYAEGVRVRIFPLEALARS